MSSADRSRHVALTGVLIALASVLGLVESVFLPPLPVPGVRLGLANIAVLVAVVTLGVRWALTVSVARVLVVGVYTGSLLGPAGLLSLAGALAAWVVIALLAGSGDRFSIVGWSIGGAAAHVIAQLAVAALLFGSSAILALAPVSLSLSALCGLATGLVAQTVVSRALLSRAQQPLVMGTRRMMGAGADGTAASR